MRLTLKRMPSLLNLLWFFPLLLFAPTVFSGQALVWGTPALQFIPWRMLAWEQIRGGVWPFWNPLNGMGAPLLANYQLALYYPPGWLLFAFQMAGETPWMAWGYTFLLAAHLAWAGFGTARLVKQLGASEPAQVIAGLAFSLSGYLVARGGFFSMIWSAAWLPWIVLCIERLAVETTVKFKIRQIGWLALCVGMQLLSGHAQITWYSLIFAGVWTIVTGWSRRGWRGALTLSFQAGLGVLLGAVIASAQLIPTFELLQQSQRASAVNYDSAMTYSFWPWRFLALFSANFFGNPAFGDYWGYASFWEDATYIGLLPLALALSTFKTLWKRAARPAEGLHIQSRTRLLWAMGLIGALLALGKNTPIFPFLYRHVPTFDMFQAPARYMLWLVFSLSLLAALGFDRWQRPTGKALRRLKKTPLVILAVLLGAAAAYFLVPGIKNSFIYSTVLTAALGLLIVWLALKQPIDAGDLQKQMRWAWLVAAFVGLDLVLAGIGLNPSTAMRFYSNESQNPSTSPGRIYLDNQSEYQLKFSRFLRFTDFRSQESWNAMRQAQIPNLNILDGQASANNFDPLRPARYEEWMLYLSSLPAEERLPWLRSMGVDQVESITQTGENDYQIQSVTGSKRFSFYPCAILVGNAADAWTETKRVIEGGIHEVVIEKAGSSIANCNARSDDKISIQSERATRIVLSVESGQDGWLVMADTWYPGWAAEIDGQPVEIERANFVFRAVPLQAGKHTVVISYRPGWLWPSFILSLFGLALSMLLLVIGRKQKMHT